MFERFGRRVLAATPELVRPFVRRVAWAVVALGLWFRAVPRFGPLSFVARSPNAAREAHAVAAGMAAFRRGTGKRQGTDYTLRRNTHRLEKGLISRPRREVFATTYVEETVAHLIAAMDREGESAVADAECAWARDVLGEYFAVVGRSPEIDRARSAFEAGVPPTSDESGVRLIPFIREVSETPPVSYDALLRLVERRRSVRMFVDRQVPRDLIDAAIEVAAQSPSACNRQPFEFLVFEGQDRVQRVAAIPGGAAGYEDNIPVLVAVVGKLDAFFSDRDRHVIYIDGSLASMAFMLALETLGLSSCAINTPGTEMREQELADELDLSPFERPVMLIAVGYPDRTALVPRSTKKPLIQLRRYVS